MAEKKYGHFDDDNREYVITDPQTPGLGSTIWETRISSRSSPIQQAAIPSTRTQNSGVSPATDTMVCLWTMAAAISTSRTATPYGTPGGNLARHHSTPMSVDMA